MKKIITLLSVIIIAISIMITTGYAANNKINWTENELTFMKNHPIIRLGVGPRFVPFEFIDEDGEYKGIATDYLSLISERTGLGARWGQVQLCIMLQDSIIPLAKQF